MDQQTKQQLLQQLQEKFQETKEKLNFKSSFQQIDEICHLEDAILSVGFVSEQFSRQMINRLVEMYYSWVPVLHSWIMPPQYDLIYLNESKQITEQEKQEIKDMVKTLMYFVRKNKTIAFDNLKREAEFLDELVEFYTKKFKNTMFRYNEKFEKYWEQEKNKKPLEN